MENNQVSKMLKLTRIAFFINAVVWLVFGILSFIRAMKDTSDVRLILSWLMLANAIVMIELGVLIVHRRPWILFIAILFMALNVVLSITDQFGWIDAVILLLNLCVLTLLLVTSHRLKQAEKTFSGEL